jgi:hypothetical protein
VVAVIHAEFGVDAVLAGWVLAVLGAAAITFHAATPDPAGCAVGFR